MRKNNLRGTILAASLAAAAIGMAQDIRVTVNGDAVDFRGAEPSSMNGRVYVPLRGVFEEMGAFVDWDSANRTVTANRGDTDVRLRIGDRFALVDGRTMEMDAPARVVNGRTMVPLRFLSESLGANVEWVRADRLVAISTDGIATNRNRNRTETREERRELRNARRITIESGTVIPVTLDQSLSSNGSREGDRFTATVRGSAGDYAGLPDGTKIEGVVQTARAKSGKNPGLLELDFTRVRLPDGRTANLDAALIGLDEESVTRNSEGVYTARSGKRDDRIVYAGYGAGAGLLVGLLTKKPLEGAVLGGALGYLLGQVQKDQRQASDVRLQGGTEFGVRLDRDLTVRPNG